MLTVYYIVDKTQSPVPWMSFVTHKRHGPPTLLLRLTLFVPNCNKIIIAWLQLNIYRSQFKHFSQNNLLQIHKCSLNESSRDQVLKFGSPTRCLEEFHCEINTPPFAQPAWLE